MALLWTDGCDKYTTAANLTVAGLYSSATNHSVLTTGGVSGGGAIRMTGSGGSQITKTVTGVISAGNGVHVCAWIKLTTQLSTNGGQMIGIGTNVVASNSNGGRVVGNSDGSISVTIHNSTTTLATSPVVFALGTYAHIEYAAKYNTAALGGYIKVWINGNLVINFAGTTISGAVPSTFTEVRFGTAFGSGVVDVDDIIVWDEVGTDFALTQLTTAYVPRIETLDGDANDTVQFTPSAGSNFQNIDDALYNDGDSTYNSSVTPGHEDLFTLTNQSGSPLYTFGIALKTVWRTGVPSIMNMRDKLDSGGTVTYSADRLMATTYAHAWSPFGKDPNTGAVWAVSAINSVKIGYKLQSVAPAIAITVPQTNLALSTFAPT